MLLHMLYRNMPLVPGFMKSRFVRSDRWYYLARNLLYYSILHPIAFPHTFPIVCSLFGGNVDFQDSSVAVHFAMLVKDMSAKG